MKTSELTDAALDWAVAKCEGKCEGDFAWYYDRRNTFKYSTDWAQGGPIIEREYIQLTIDLAWEAHIVCEDKKFGVVERFGCTGPTPLIAAMRCFVASRLGDEVEVPEELK
jgi:hypothetical protein